MARRVDNADAFVVTVLCDTGERYLSKLYNDEWMRENQMLDPSKVTLGSLLEGKREASASQVISVAPGATVRQALRLMQQHDISQLPVMEGANCTGSVNEYGLSTRALESPRVLEATVSESMDPPFPIVDAGTPADSVTKLLTKANPAVLVREDGTLRGIVTRSDLIAYLMAR